MGKRSGNPASCTPDNQTLPPAAQRVSVARVIISRTVRPAASVRRAVSTLSACPMAPPTSRRVAPDVPPCRTAPPRFVCLPVWFPVEIIRFVLQKLYLDCSCSSPSQPVWPSSSSSSTARPGLCPLQCNTLTLYIIVFSVTVLIHSTSEVGAMLLTLRCVQPQDKAMALGFLSFATSLFGETETTEESNL